MYPAPSCQPRSDLLHKKLFLIFPAALPLRQDHFKQFPTPGPERLDLFRGLPWEGMVMGKIPGGGGELVSVFAGYVPLASPNPYPIIVYSVASYRPHVSHFWANIPQIPTCQNLLNPEIPQMCDPILVTLLAPNENATPL